MKELYYFWNPPDNGMPEASGHGIQIVPGMKQFVLLHATVREIPAGAIPVSEVVKFLESKT